MVCLSRAMASFLFFMYYDLSAFSYIFCIRILIFTYGQIPRNESNIVWRYYSGSLSEYRSVSIPVVSLRVSSAHRKHIKCQYQKRLSVV